EDRVAPVERLPQGAPLRAVEHLEAEPRVLEALRQVGRRAVREIVDPDDLVAVREQAATTVRTQHPPPSRASPLPPPPPPPARPQTSSSRASPPLVLSVFTWTNFWCSQAAMARSNVTPKAPWS